MYYTTIINQMEYWALLEELRARANPPRPPTSPAGRPTRASSYRPLRDIFEAKEVHQEALTVSVRPLPMPSTNTAREADAPPAAGCTTDKVCCVCHAKERFHGEKWSFTRSPLARSPPLLCLSAHTSNNPFRQQLQAPHPTADEHTAASAVTPARAAGGPDNGTPHASMPTTVHQVQLHDDSLASLHHKGASVGNAEHECQGHKQGTADTQKNHHDGKTYDTKEVGPCGRGLDANLPTYERVEQWLLTKHEESAAAMGLSASAETLLEWRKAFVRRIPALLRMEQVQQGNYRKSNMCRACVLLNLWRGTTHSLLFTHRWHLQSRHVPWTPSPSLPMPSPRPPPMQPAPRVPSMPWVCCLDAATSTCCSSQP